jgi:uncharacterized protein (TIGR01777 family)
MHRHQQISHLPQPPQAVWDWHLRPGALARLTPPWQRVRVLRHEGVAEGSRAELEIREGPLTFRWLARHDRVEAGRSFRDVQERGPFAAWMHEHRCEPDGDGTRYEDDIAWEPAWWMPSGRVARDLARAFAWRHRRVAEDLARHAAASLPRLRIAVSGAGGLVGADLCAFLNAGGHEVVPISRRGGGIAWDGRSTIDAAALRTCDAVVHLAGANVAERRWDEAWRREIRDSRVLGTAAIAQALAADPGRVRTLVVAGGAGYYGDRGEAELDERSSGGSGFLAEVCRDWERAADPCRDRVRTVHLRIGVVLSARGGALAKLLPPARFGLGGALGSGLQWWPWIALDDLVYLVHAAIADQRLAGVVNAVAPELVRQGELARTLARVLGRPVLAPPAPAAVLRLALGAMADEALLASARIAPKVLLDHGFRWSQPGLEVALADTLGIVRSA